MSKSEEFEVACQRAQAGLLAEAQLLFQELAKREQGDELALVLNNLAAVEAASGDVQNAQQLFEEVLALKSDYEPAIQNLDFLKQLSHTKSGHSDQSSPSPVRRIAIVSLLFNWPSTGGGTVHTKELAQFLTLAGYEVHQFYAVQQEWGIGMVSEHLPYPTTPLLFHPENWNAENIRNRFRTAIDQFAPDAVIVTDSWNTKPLLAEAVQEYPYFIRIAALECICPLNNVRMLIDKHKNVLQCEKNQLSDAATCQQCVMTNIRNSGQLHQAERQLAGFDADDYGARLNAAFTKAEGTLVVNPEIAEAVRPFTKSVHVLPSGFDASRFPTTLAKPAAPRQRKRILFAGVIHEFIKGFHILSQAGELLWNNRQNFEIWATADPVGQVNEFTRHVGWQSQESLPALMSECDILVFPTLAQEALGRTAVEAMACSRPVIASNLGGLPFVVEEGVTGLLCKHSDPVDLAAKCEQLLDDQELCEQMGKAGRSKFLKEFTWDVILKDYLALLGSPEKVNQEYSPLS